MYLVGYASRRNKSVRPEWECCTCACVHAAEHVQYVILKAIDLLCWVVALALFALALSPWCHVKAKSSKRVDYRPFILKIEEGGRILFLFYFILIITAQTGYIMHAIKSITLHVYRMHMSVYIVVHIVHTCTAQNRKTWIIILNVYTQTRLHAVDRCVLVWGVVMCLRRRRSVSTSESTFCELYACVTA